MRSPLNPYSDGSWYIRRTHWLRKGRSEHLLLFAGKGDTKLFSGETYYERRLSGLGRRIAEWHTAYAKNVNDPYPLQTRHFDFGEGVEHETDGEYDVISTPLLCDEQIILFASILEYGKELRPQNRIVTPSAIQARTRVA